MGVQKVIVGLPLTMSGQYGKMAQETERFVKHLRLKIGMPVEMWDERLTSVQAKRVLKDSRKAVRRDKSNVDCLAAVLLLQSYLDRERNGSEAGAEETD